MFQTYGSARPRAGQGWQLERPRAQTPNRNFAQRRLPGDVQRDFDGALQGLGREVEVVFGAAQRIGQFDQLFGQIALELEQPPRRFRAALGPLGVECAPFVQHRFLDLSRDDRPDFAQVFANRLDFVFDPNKWAWLEGRAKDSAWETTRAEPLPVDNRTVLHLLEALQILRTQTPGLALTARVVSFRALDIEQIGHVYEGLLDHTVLRASETMVSLKGARDQEPEIALSTLEELAPDGAKFWEFVARATGRSKETIRKEMQLGALEHLGPLNRVCGDEALTERVTPLANLIRTDAFGLPVVIRAGSLYVTRGSDRRSSGTHYTPRTLTEPLVARTLDPLVFRDFELGVPTSRETLKTAREILDLKICDPACGSAGVLVRVCRYLSQRLLEAWEIAEENAGIVRAKPSPFDNVSEEGAATSGSPNPNSQGVGARRRGKA